MPKKTKVNESSSVVKVDKYDTNAVKNAIDDAIIEYFGEDMKLKRNFNISNIQLILGFIGCCCALVAQFYPEPFPDNKTVLYIVCPLYFIISLLLTLVSSFWEKDQIFESRATRSLKPIIVRTDFPLYTDMFTISIEFKDNPEKKIKVVKSITSWFTKKGELQTSELKADVGDIFNKLRK
eukprot:TRINITY_DN6527_c0_g2_i1.p1 TRINITY_DN6527_c0_g2~~TRINITY_DN6527_c0_g2_i1.p1  ORF type:complete len:180 (-),score=33.44 TRINITY_DN6527_c0_g2_i1:74-613(-)